MIHKFKMNGFNIVLDIESSSVFSVDDLVYDILDDYKNESLEDIVLKLSNKYKEEEIKEAYFEIKKLVDDEIIYSETIDVSESFKDRNAQVKALCLNVTHDCNLACKYCFAEEGAYQGEKELMSFETAKKAIDFLVLNSKNKHNLEIDFFGGEPLMNFEMIKETVKYAESLEDKYNKNFRFTITTNAVLLDDEKIDYINEKMKNVVISVDGRKTVHDKMRPNKAGKGSYDKVIENTKRLLAKRGDKEHYIRGTFTSYNKDFSEDVFDLANQGFKEISMEPVVEDESIDYAIKNKDLAEIKNEYEKLAVEMLLRKKEGKDFNFFHFNIDLAGGPCIYKRVSSCGAGSEYLAVSPDGKLYPCHQFVGMKDFEMGTVDSGVLNLSLQEKMNNNTLYQKENCQDCFAKYFCSGGCQANSYKYAGSLDANHDISCQMQKKRIECALMLEVSES